MGLETKCDVRHSGRTVTVTAHLEPAELRLQSSGLALRVPMEGIKSAVARAGVLHVEWKGGRAELLLGKDAPRWELKIRYPRSRLDKLGIKPGMRVAVVGVFDRDFLEELRERTSDVSVGRPRK